ncbi:Arc family DNA-binding protein [Vibrio cholerae]
MTRYRNPQYQLRMAPELREKIQEAADTANRSLHAEIIARLENSFESEQKDSEIAELTYQVKLLLQMMREKEGLDKAKK